MVFPADKETWRRVEGKDLPLSKLGDVIEDTDHNDYADFLERLQDVLGLTILSGFGSVKLRLADIDTKIGDAGDFLADGSVPMTGDLNLDGNDIDNAGKIGVGKSSPGVALDCTGSGADTSLKLQNTGTVGTEKCELIFNPTKYGVTARIRVSNADLQFLFEIQGEREMYFKTNSSNKIVITYTGQLKFYEGIHFISNYVFSSPFFSLQSDMELKQNGKGFICKSPDGTKKARIGIDNAGNLLVTAL